MVGTGHTQRRSELDMPVFTEREGRMEGIHVWTVTYEALCQGVPRTATP